MVDLLASPRLIDRFQRSTRAPRLMMLYPPVATGERYDRTPDEAALWRDAPNLGTLYVHLPFCRTRCGFCPFHATTGGETIIESYVDAVLAEAERYSPHVDRKHFTSVYLGGGTPGLLPPATIGRLLSGLGARLHLEGADVTMETHPRFAELSNLRAMRQAGVTRLSLGVQSFDPWVLRAAGRADTVDQVGPAAEAAMAAGFDDVNIDLMYGLPEQTFGSWRADLERCASLGIPGLTLYATVYLPEFLERCKSRGFTVPSEAARFAMYEVAFDYLRAHGYPGARLGAGAFVRHELNAHRRNVSLGLPMLGLGTWAYSSTGSFAYHNHFPMGDWMQALAAGHAPIRQIVRVSPAERSRKYVIEALLLGYVSLAAYRVNFGTELEDDFAEEIGTLRHLGLVKIDEGELQLTREGARHLRSIRYLFASEDVVGAMERDATGGL